MNRGSSLIIQSNRSDYREIQGFKFNKLQDSINSALELINPDEQRDFLELDHSEHFPKEVFSSLIELCINDKRLFRAIKIITQSRNLPEELSTSAYFVALETVKNIIVEENINKIKPFKNEKLAKQSINKLKNMICEINETEFNDKEAILRKLENLDHLGNNESFFKAFELLNITLTKEDKERIKMRNRFLHGNIPFQDEPEDGKVKQLHIIELKAHFLTCALILKYAGFNGFLKNSLKFLDRIKFDDSIEESLFREI